MPSLVSCVICSSAICHFGRNSTASGTPAARIDTRGHRFDALPLARQTQPGDIVPEGTMSISVTETGGETLNIRVKPLGAGAREVGHTWRVPAYPMNSLTFLTQSY